MVSTDVAELWVYLITVFSDLFLYVGISVSLLQRNRTSRMYFKEFAHPTAGLVSLKHVGRPAAETLRQS